jgi:hypothetical protein
MGLIKLVANTLNEVVIMLRPGALDADDVVLNVVGNFQINLRPRHLFASKQLAIGCSFISARDYKSL